MLSHFPGFPIRLVTLYDCKPNGLLYNTEICSLHSTGIMIRIGIRIRIEISQIQSMEMSPNTDLFLQIYGAFYPQ